MPALREPEFASAPPEVQTTIMKKAGVSQPEDRHITRVREQPFLMDGDFLKITNDDSSPVTFRWNRKYYTIEPHEEMFVPFEALVDALGDPRSMENNLTKYSDGQGSKGIIMDRHWELTRLFARYAVENENIEELCMKAPRVRAETLSGQPVRFPCQLPDMLPLPVPMVDPLNVNNDTVTMIDKVAAENADLRSKLEEMERRMDDELSRREGINSPEE